MHQPALYAHDSPLGHNGPKYLLDTQTDSTVVQNTEIQNIRCCYLALINLVAYNFIVIMSCVDGSFSPNPLLT